MDPVKQQLTDRFIELVELINQRMHSRMPEGWSDLDLTIPQVRTLCLLHQEPQRMGSIATALGTTLPSASSIIDRMVDKGLIERLPDPDDRRVVICRLTPQGMEAVDQFWRIGRIRITEMANHMTVEELETVVKAMEILNRASELAIHSDDRPDDRPDDRLAAKD